MTNRSVPVDTVLPHLTYSDLPAAIAWLTETFGFTEHYRYGAPDGAQMYLGRAFVMLNSARPGRTSPAQSGIEAQPLTVFVENVDAHFERSQSAGAKIWEDLHVTVYGERQYGVEDPEGHRWLFSQHARDISPDEWGATIANPPPAGR